MAFLAPIAPYLAVASAGMSALGAIQQGNASAAAAGYNAKIAGRNAEINKQNAAYEGAVGESQAAQAGLKTQSDVGAVKARQAANGVDVNSGSAASVRSSHAEMGMLNAMNIRSNAARRAYGFETQAQGNLMQARLDRMEQSQDKRAGYMRAAADVAGGAASYAMFSPPDGGATNVASAGGNAGTYSYMGSLPQDNYPLYMNNSYSTLTY